MEEDITSDTLSEENISLDGNEAASDEIVNIKDVLSETLGKQFDSDEAALKAVKDTFGYVGKMGQKVKDLESKINSNNPDISSKVESLEKAVKEANFYAENPEYKEYKNLINAFGNNPEEIIKSDVFKETYTKIKAHDEIEKSKSVLQSNPRLGQVKDKISQAREAANSGNYEMAKNSAVEAVIDAFNI